MVGLDKEDVEWFEKAYGEGKLSWILTLLLCEFRKASALKPADYAAIAAHVLRDKIDSV